MELMTIITVPDFRLSQPGGPSPYIYPQEQHSLFVASYDLQGYRGGIRTCLHVGGIAPESESELELLYDWQFTANQFILATSPLGLTTSNFIFQLNTCDYSPYVKSSVMRGWVCRLQLLLVLASAVDS
jgi:hypothetical protein